MKKLFLNVLFMLPIICFTQHKGNASHEKISRQNIASGLGNAVLYGKPPKQHQTNLYTSNNITIDLKALCNVKANSYTAIFNLAQIGTTAEETHSLMKERIDHMKTSLASQGILAKDITIDVISFIPRYEVAVEKKLFSKKYNEVPKGFELQQNIHIRFTETHQFEKILAACAKNEIYNLVKVDYFIKDIHLIYKKLQAALLKLVAEKKTFYTTLGFDFKTFNTQVADNKYCYFPKDFYHSYQAFNSISFEAIKKSKGITKAQKLTSYYYQPLTYENYDIVMNPSILEPVVQVGMDLKLLYNPKPKEQPKLTPQPKTNHKYYVVSPNGNIDIKELKK